MKKLFLLLIILSTLNLLLAQDEFNSDLEVEVGNIIIPESSQNLISPLEEFENSAYRLIHTDPDIFSGPYLVYDCINKRYICMDEFTNDKCIESRQKSLIDNIHILNCAPLKKFDTFYNCTRANQLAIENSRAVKFCFKEVIKEN